MNNAAPKPPKTAKVPKPQKKKVYSGTGLYWGFLAVLIVMAALVILAAQNTLPVAFTFLVWKLEYPLVAILLAAIAGTVILDEAVGFVWRHRRRRVLAERHELKELRAKAAAMPVETSQPLGPVEAIPAGDAVEDLPPTEDALK